MLAPGFGNRSFERDTEMVPKSTLKGVALIRYFQCQVEFFNSAGNRNANAAQMERKYFSKRVGTEKVE